MSHSKKYFIELASNELNEEDNLGNLRKYAAGDKDAEANLSESDEKKLSIFFHVWSEMLLFTEDQKIIKKIARLHFAHLNHNKISQQKCARDMVKEAKELFKLAHPVDEELERTLNIQTLKRAASIALKEGNIGIARLCIRDASELQGLFKDKSVLPDKDMAMGMHVDSFTTDFNEFKGIMDEHREMMEKAEDDAD